jgi:hypothetical protein
MGEATILVAFFQERTGGLAEELRAIECLGLEKKTIVVRVSEEHLGDDNFMRISADPAYLSRRGTAREHPGDDTTEGLSGDSRDSAPEGADAGPTQFANFLLAIDENSLQGTEQLMISEVKRLIGARADG